jgi:hypothetical protein
MSFIALYSLTGLCIAYGCYLLVTSDLPWHLRLWVASHVLQLLYVVAVQLHSAPADPNTTLYTKSWIAVQTLVLVVAAFWWQQ